MRSLALWRMARRPPDRGPEEDFERAIRNLGDRLRNIFGGGGGGGNGDGGGGGGNGPRGPGGGGAPSLPIGRILLVVIVVALIGWGATGIYTVQPGEQGVIRQFGKSTGIVASSGLNYRLPSPIQSVVIVDTQAVRRVEIGFRTNQGVKQENLAEALMLTEDENIVQVELLVQYTISSAPDFVFNVQNPEAVLRTAAEVALRSAVGQMTVDAVITESRGQVQVDTKLVLVGLMSSYDSGIQVGEVLLQVADPPEQVRDAFQEVVRARADKERLINEAQAYQNDVVPRASGQATELINQARAFEAARVAEAEGEADRFLAFVAGLGGIEGQAALVTYLGALEDSTLLDLEEQEAARLVARTQFLTDLGDLTTSAGYVSARDVTRQRLYLETMERILPGIRKFILTPDAGGSLLQFLPLEDGATFPPEPVVETP